MLLFIYNKCIVYNEIIKCLIELKSQYFNRYIIHFHKWSKNETY